MGYIPGTEKASVHLWDDAQKKQIPVWYSMTWLREMNDLQNRCGELSGEALASQIWDAATAKGVVMPALSTVERQLNWAMDRCVVMFCP